MTFLGRPGGHHDWEQKHVKKNDTGKAANKKGSQDAAQRHPLAGLRRQRRQPAGRPGGTED